MRDIGVQEELLPHSVHSGNDQIIHLMIQILIGTNLLTLVVKFASQFQCNSTTMQIIYSLPQSLALLAAVPSLLVVW